jgi:hypothetical protein
MKSHRYRTLAVAAATALLAACYQDEFKPSPGFDGFLDLVGRECYPDTIGPILVRQWAQGSGPGGGSGAGFIDATSSLYYGKWTTVQYRQFITAMSDNGAATNKGIDCIISKLPAQRPGAAGSPPAGRDGVPPPPSR